MRYLPICLSFMLAVAASARGDEPNNRRVTKHLESNSYVARWDAIPTYAATAELEIGDAVGHGEDLGWMWFKPGKDGVDVLSVKYSVKNRYVTTKWRPDTPIVTIKKARLKSSDYGVLLKDLAIVNAAKLYPRDSEMWMSTSDFWVSARLADGEKALMDLDWVGYAVAREQIHYAKPSAAVTLAQEAVKKLDFKDHKLTATERACASEKFIRDWKRCKDKKFSEWVFDRCIITIGVVGDASAYPTLREIVAQTDNNQWTYSAINAVTRLTGKDVRTKPVEEMDLEKMRPKVLELIKDK